MNWIWKPSAKRLGPLDLSDAKASDRFMERKHEADAMPSQFLQPRPAGFIAAYRWITNYRELPEVPHDFDERLRNQRNVRWLGRGVR